MPTQLSSLFRSSTAVSIRNAESPSEALRLFRDRIRCNLVDPFQFHAAVFVLKQCSRAPHLLLLLLPHLHAHLLKTSLLSSIHVTTSLLSSYSLTSFPSARQLFDQIPQPNLVTYNTMITCLCSHDHLRDAIQLFDRMPERDIVSYSALIDGHIRRGQRQYALSVFRKMIAQRIRPDPSVIVTALTACADTGSLALTGKSLHAYAEKNFMYIDSRLATKLIDMYTKLGRVGTAYRVFERIPERNTMHWTAMICGLANHGNGNEAIELFEVMYKSGVKPNEITFTTVLNACCNGGLVEEGKKYFGRMVDIYGFEPSVHHYGCMVDMFAKSGKLDEAFEIIENMNVEPNIIILTSFLAGCRTHKNFKIAGKVMERVLKMVIPDDDGGVYTLISNIYAMEGRWNDEERVRQMMERHKVRKNRGAAFIEKEEIASPVG